MANLVPKIPASTWIAAARDTLIQDGIDAVKIDRLANRLGVTRGGFYHHFTDRAALLESLVNLWRDSVVFVSPQLSPADPGGALEAIDTLVDHLINEESYNPRFDMAVRAWAHADPEVNSAVEQGDLKRIVALEGIFTALGCDEEEAGVRARVFYFHQIGYYAIGVKESRASRRARVDTYIRILCGDANLAAAHRWVASARRPAETSTTNRARRMV